MYPFPEYLRDDPGRHERGEKLRAEGNITGRMCCLKCFVVSSYFVRHEDNTPVTAQDLIQLQCPHCGNIGSVFLHDDECLDSYRKNETTGA